MSGPAAPCFLSHFSALRDQRQATKVLYPLAEILLLMLCAIAGADDFVEIGLWGGERQDFLRRFLPYEHSIPSHDTLCDVISAIDPLRWKASRIIAPRAITRAYRHHVQLGLRFSRNAVSPSRPSGVLKMLHKVSI
jgi:hypothetical protein